MALAWHFEDEVSDAVRSVARRALSEAVVVPQHWHLEITNALLRGERRQRTSMSATSAFLERLQDMTTEVEGVEPSRVELVLLPLARSYRLSVYDAAYLDLAMRRLLPLATRDQALAAAARTAGVELIGAEGG